MSIQQYQLHFRSIDSFSTELQIEAKLFAELHKLLIGHFEPRIKLFTFRVDNEIDMNITNEVCYIQTSHYQSREILGCRIEGRIHMYYHIPRSFDKKELFLKQHEKLLNSIKIDHEYAYWRGASRCFSQTESGRFLYLFFNVVQKKFFLLKITDDTVWSTEGLKEIGSLIRTKGELVVYQSKVKSVNIECILDPVKIIFLNEKGSGGSMIASDSKNKIDIINFLKTNNFDVIVKRLPY